MAKINGSSLILYVDGQAVAGQRGGSLSMEADLPETTDKFSEGWEEHDIDGKISGTIDFDALMTTTGLTADGLIDKIIDREDLLALFYSEDMTKLFLAKTKLKSHKVEAPGEQPLALSGSLQINGKPYFVSGNIMPSTFYTNNYTSFSWDNEDRLGTVEASQTSGSAYARARRVSSITTNDVILFVGFLSLTSGEAPSVQLLNSVGSSISAKEQLVEGANLIELTATGSDGEFQIELSNTAATEFYIYNTMAFKL